MPSIVGEKLILDQVGYNSEPSLQEQTRTQVAAFSGATGISGVLGLPGQDGNYGTGLSNNGIVTLGQNWRSGNHGHYLKIRTMRRHPTIKLVRTLSCAGMALAKWSAETNADAPDGAKEVVQDICNMQGHILTSANPGIYDFGWQAYEKIQYFDVDSGRTKLRKLKPLLQDQTRIMVDKNTGAYAGVQNQSKFLARSNSLLLNQDVEGTYWYGESDMSAIEPAYDRWLVTDRSNVQYDRKIAGAHWIVHFPEGVSEFNGVVTDNFEVAKRFIRELEGSGSIAVPSTVLNAIKELGDANNEEAWRVELVAAPPAQADFSARMQYLDSLMVRGGGFPERSILEGQYGTKAEAGEHADFAIARMDFRNKNLVDLLNWHLVNGLLRLNLGGKAENSAFITVAPIADDKKDFLKQLYIAALANPGVSGSLYQSMDFKAIREQLQVPSTDHSGSDEDINNMLQMLQNPDNSPYNDQQDPNQPPPQLTGDQQNAG